jgi:transposase
MDEENLLRKIKTYSKDLWNPENISRTPIKTNSWFEMSKGLNDHGKTKTKHIYDNDKLGEVEYKSRPMILLPNDFQKKVLLSWIDSYTEMYNETLKVINTHLFRTKSQRKGINRLFQLIKESNTINHKQQLSEIRLKEYLYEYEGIIAEHDSLLNGKPVERNKKQKGKKLKKKRLYPTPRFPINFPDIRTIYMKNIKSKIIAKSGINEPNVNTKIHSHILDNAIKDVCISFKSAMTNLRNGNIKHFRVRYIKKTKLRKTIRFEQSSFASSGNTFCPTVLGDKIKTNSGDNFSNVHNGGTLMYNYETEKFTLFVPEIVVRETIRDRGEVIAFDPGVTTLLTGYSTDHVLEVSPKLRRTVSKILKKIDNVDNLPVRNDSVKRTEIHTITKSQKRNKIQKLKTKLHNMIDDLHWKCIKYTTDNYDTILIGNLSTKSIVKKKPFNELDKMTKRVAMSIRLHVFHSRLKYKCYIKSCNYRKVNEKHTSQLCSYCGNKKTNLGLNRMYHCEKCKKTIERDINGARNILLVGIMEIK